MIYKINFLYYWILACSIFLGQQAYGQKTGDYRTGGSGNWNDPGVWRKYDGIIWQPSSSVPSSSVDIITIRHIITINSGVTVNKLILDGGIVEGVGDLTVVNDLVLDGEVAGTGRLIVKGNVTWTIGTLGRSVVIDKDRTITFAGLGVKTLTANLTVDGIMKGVGDIQNGQIKGTGSITVNSPFYLSGTMDSDVGLILNNDFTLAGNIRGSGSLQAKGYVNWLSGELGRALTIAKSQLLRVQSFEYKSLRAPLTLNGSMELSYGIYCSSILTNNGTIKMVGNGFLSRYGIGYSSSFVNSATLEGVGFIDMPFTNTATGVIRGGGFTLYDTFINKGTIEPGFSSPGILAIERAQPLSSESILIINIQKNSKGKVSNGQLLRKVGNLELAGKLKVIETGDVPDGSYRVVFLESPFPPAKLLGDFASVELPDRYKLNISGNCVFIDKTTDICNGIDDDKDGKIDEDASLTTWYADKDKDGFGSSTGSISSCSKPSGYVATNTDCNDNNPRINPSVVEVCNGVDDNCDGKVDDNCTLSIAAWPNPSTNDFQFSLTGDSNEPVKVTILDAAGVPLKKLDLFIGDETRFGQDLRAGVYMIEAWQGSQRKVIKVVKF